MASTTSGLFELLTGSSSPLLASGDVVCFVDVSDTTQAAQGSLVKGTLTQFFAAIPVPVVVTSASANALAVGLTGATNSAFTVDASTALQVAGLKVTGAVTGGTVALVTTDSGAATNLTINAKGTGTIGIGSVSTGRVTITPVTTITGALTLSATLAAAGAGFSGDVVITRANSANSFVVGRQGLTNPAFRISASSVSVTGILLTPHLAGSGVDLSVLSSGTDENLNIDALGAGTITLNGTATGGITLARAVTASVGLTVTTGGLTVSAGTTAVQALTATTYVGSSSVTAASLNITAGAAPGSSYAMNLRTGQTMGWGDGTNRGGWRMHTDYTMHFDTNALSDAVIFSTGGGLALSAGITATTAAFSGAFGCNGSAAQTKAVSGGTLAGVIAALVANGILSS